MSGGKLIFRDGHARPLPLHQGHGGRRRLDLDPTVTLPDVEGLTTLQPQALAQGLRNHHTTGPINGRSHGIQMAERCRTASLTGGWASCRRRRRDPHGGAPHALGAGARRGCALELGYALSALVAPGRLPTRRRGRRRRGSVHVRVAALRDSVAALAAGTRALTATFGAHAHDVEDPKGGSWITRHLRVIRSGVPRRGSVDRRRRSPPRSRDGMGGLALRRSRSPSAFGPARPPPVAAAPGCRRRPAERPGPGPRRRFSRREGPAQRRCRGAEARCRARR